MHSAHTPATAFARDLPRFNASLDDLPLNVAQALIQAGTVKTWRKGQVVVRQGQTSAEVVVGMQGRLAVDLEGPTGADTLIGFLNKGELVGIATVMAGTPAPTAIVASGPAQTLHIPRKDFVQVLTDHPNGAIAVVTLLSHRLVELFRFIEMTSHRSLADRVRYALNRIAQRNGVPDAMGHMTLQVTQADMAKAAGASRQRVHLELKKLEAQGAIAIGYRSITVLKTELL
jgi:CRP-like cAMP-binding protein